MNKFRPQDLPKSFVVKQRLQQGRAENYNWQARVKWYPAGWGFNKRVIGDQFSRLHYLARHAPAPVQKKWSQAYDVFYKKHFGVGASMRYLNTWSCHAWL